MLLLNLILLIDVTFSTPTPDYVNCRFLERTLSAAPLGTDTSQHETLEMRSETYSDREQNCGHSNN
jgi:hypothetical protein